MCCILCVGPSFRSTGELDKDFMKNGEMTELVDSSGCPQALDPGMEVFFFSSEHTTKKSSAGRWPRGNSVRSSLRSSGVFPSWGIWWVAFSVQKQHPAVPTPSCPQDFHHPGCFSCTPKAGRVRKCIRALGLSCREGLPESPLAATPHF